MAFLRDDGYGLDFDLGLFGKQEFKEQERKDFNAECRRETQSTQRRMSKGKFAKEKIRHRERSADNAGKIRGSARASAFRTDTQKPGGVSGASGLLVGAGLLAGISCRARR